jgi:hypothetical protein
MVLTYIWVSFFFIAFAVGLVQLVFFGNTQIFPDMMKAAFEMAETAVMKIGLPLTGVITLFMGLMKIGELGGMIGIMSKRPSGKWEYHDEFCCEYVGTGQRRNTNGLEGDARNARSKSQ